MFCCPKIEQSRGGAYAKNRVFVLTLNRAQVVPLTSNIDRLYPSEAYVTINGKQGKAMADQLATVSKLRLLKKVGTLSAEDMEKVGEAIKIQLDLK